MDIRALLRDTRRSAGLTQATVAERLGTTQSAVARWESGRIAPRLDTVARLFAACGFEIRFDVTSMSPQETERLTDALRLSPIERLDRLSSFVQFVDRAQARPPAKQGRLEPARLLALAASHRLDFLVVGGIAAALHGSPFPTRDIDLLVLRDDLNLSRLQGFLAAVDAVPGDTPGGGSWLQHLDRIQLASPGGPLDIRLRGAGSSPPWRDLKARAITMWLPEADIPVAALEDLIRWKRRTADRQPLHGLRVLRQLAERRTD